MLTSFSSTSSRRAWVADGELSDQAGNNTIDNFRLVFDRKFLQTIITRVDANDEIYKKILDDETSARPSASSTCARSTSAYVMAVDHDCTVKWWFVQALQ